MLPFIESYLKHAALEVQEYVRLVVAAFHALFTKPRYRYDIVEQFDVIGVGSLTVVLLTGFFTGAALTSQSGITLDQFGARPIVVGIRCLVAERYQQREAHRVARVLIPEKLSERVPDAARYRCAGGAGSVYVNLSISIHLRRSSATSGIPA